MLARLTSTKRIWLCVEAHDDGSTRVHGDTGRGGFDDPYKPDLCQYGGYFNHNPLCGWWLVARPVEEE